MEVKTIEEKYSQYSGKEFNLRLNDNKNMHESKKLVTICGYVEKSKLLIGRVHKSSGMTGQFKSPTSTSIIPNHIEGSRYVYVYLGCLEKVVKVKRIVKKRDILEDIESIEDDIIF